MKIETRRQTDARGTEENASRPTLLCLSHLRWSFVYQRPQHLLSRAALDHQVIFFEEPMFEPVARPELRLETNTDGVTVAVPVMREGLSASTVTRLQRALLDELLAAVKPRALTTWYYTPFALTFSRHLQPNLCVYDNMDELSAFKGASTRLLALEAEMFARADLVFTGGQSLYEAKRGRHSNIHPFPSSVDVLHFRKARAGGADAPEHAGLSRPRLGFFGVIDERMNLGLVDDLARMRSDWEIVMIGPVAKIDANALPRRPNLHWIGSKKYEELPAYLAGWDVGIMPFAINEATRYISPTKTPEFLAAGLPVVSTPITDVVRSYGTQGLVEIAEDAAGFAARCDAMLARPRQPWLARVDRQLAALSWEETWAGMTEHMKAARSAKPSRSFSRLPANLEDARV